MSSEKSIYTLGASNHSKKERSERDYYGTDPRATRALLRVEKFSENVWEPCAGRHKMSDVLKEAGYNVRTSDIFDYGCGNEIFDFLSENRSTLFSEPAVWDGDVVTNPPYCDAVDFVETSLAIIPEGHKVAMFLRLAFLESQNRFERIYKDNPPKTVYIFSKRQVCSKVDDFTEGSAVSYAWFVWEKGYKGDPAIKWITE